MTLPAAGQSALRIREGLVYWQEVCENWKQEENCWLLSFDKSRRRSELWLLRPTAGKDAMEVNSRGSSRFEGAAELRGVASVWIGTQLGLWLPIKFTFNLQRLNFSRMASKPPSKLTPGHRTCTITETLKQRPAPRLVGVHQINPTSASFRRAEMNMTESTAPSLTRWKSRWGEWPRHVLFRIW